MKGKSFIEISVHNHIILHGFDENNNEITEEVKVDHSTKKFIAIDRIQSLSEKYILTTYAFGRLVYWEYDEDYDVIKSKINSNKWM